MCKHTAQSLLARGHRFRSNADSEVILHLYEERGETMVDALRGMFAFALWDERRAAMLLARDPYGIKPLYYADDGSTVTLTIAQPAEKFAMPDVRGQSVKDARKALTDAGLAVGNVAGDRGPNATVVATNPQPGQEVKKGDRVDLVAAKGGGDGGGFFGGTTGGPED